MTPKLLVDGVSKEYARRGAGRRGESSLLALEDVTLTVDAREIVCLLGPSGCGKSTLLRLIAGFEEPSAGRILVDGSPVRGPGPDRGVVFQEDSLFPWLTVWQNTLAGPRWRHEGERERVEERAREYLAAVGLTGFERCFPHELSGGMRQRAAIARVLINDPAVILMDEPFGALDAQTRVAMQLWLLRLWSKSPCAVLFITHDIDEAIVVGSRICVMSERPGRLLRCWRSPFPSPRTADIAATMPFVALKREILANLPAPSL